MNLDLIDQRSYDIVVIEDNNNLFNALIDLLNNTITIQKISNTTIAYFGKEILTVSDATDTVLTIKS